MVNLVKMVKMDRDILEIHLRWVVEVLYLSSQLVNFSQEEMEKTQRHPQRGVTVNLSMFH